MNRLLFFFLVICFGCAGPSAKKQDTSQEAKPSFLSHFQGHWVIKPYFDTLAMTPFRGMLNASQYGITEVVIDSASRDSVLFFNEDMERWKSPVSKVDSVTLGVKLTPKLTALLKLAPAGNSLVLHLDEGSPAYEYTRVPDSLAAGAPAGTAFRKMLNCGLSQLKLTAYDPNLDAPHGVKCGFRCDGSVFGIRRYRSFYVYVNGDMANCEGMDRIELSDGKKTDGYGMIFTPGGIHLYYLKKITESGEKPWYVRGEFFLELAYDKK